MSGAIDGAAKQPDTQKQPQARRRPADRRLQILKAALEVFLERGYDGGSMREIAGRVGVRESALYRHFPGKEAMLRALVQLNAEKALEEGLSLVSGLDASRLREGLLDVLRERRRAVSTQAPLLRLVIPLAEREPWLMDGLRQGVLFPMRTAITAKVTEVDNALGIKGAQASRDMRVRALLSLVAGYALSSVLLGDEEDEAMVDMALRLMGWERP